MRELHNKAVDLITDRFSELFSDLHEIGCPTPGNATLILHASIYYYLQAICLGDEEWDSLTDEDRAYIKRSAGKIKADMINIGETQMRDLLRYVYQNIDSSKATEKTS